MIRDKRGKNAQSFGLPVHSSTNDKSITAADKLQLNDDNNNNNKTNEEIMSDFISIADNWWSTPIDW